MNPGNFIIAGNPIPAFTAFQYYRSSSGQIETTNIFEGEFGQCAAYMPIASNGANEVRLSKSGVMGRLEVTRRIAEGQESEEQSIDTLDLSFNETPISIFFNPYFVGLDAQDIADINVCKDEILAIEGNTDSDRAQREAKSAELLASSASVGALKQEALEMLLEGAETYVYFSPVLVYTRNVSQNFATQLELSDVGTCFSTANLPIPSGLMSGITVPNVSNSIGVRPGYDLGWLKTARMNTTADGDRQLVTQFTYGSYSTSLYSGTFD